LGFLGVSLGLTPILGGAFYVLLAMMLPVRPTIIDTDHWQRTPPLYDHYD
jgi:hypothetical protein